MAWSGCGPSCNAPWPPRYRYWDLAFALMGTAAFLVDLGADAWVAASYLKAGDYHWGGLVLGLLALSSLATQFFSCAWYWSDPPELMEALPTRRTLLVLHILQLGYLYRCFYVLKVGFRVCRMKADKDIAYAVFLSHDISFLRLFETFLESAPQLVLGLYIILCTKKAEIFQDKQINKNIPMRSPHPALTPQPTLLGAAQGILLRQRTRWHLPFLVEKLDGWAAEDYLTPEGNRPV